MASDERLQPEPSGALVPPDRHPPTAIGTDTPEPPRPPRHARHVTVERHVFFGPDVRRMLSKMLDAVDRVADTIALELGVRPPTSRPPASGPPVPNER